MKLPQRKVNTLAKLAVPWCSRQLWILPGTFCVSHAHAWLVLPFPCSDLRTVPPTSLQYLPTTIPSILSNLTHFPQHINQHAHTHTHLTAPFPGLPGWAGTRKVKPIWISLKQETVSGSSISWDICKSAPRSRQITTPAPQHSVFYRPDALPAAQPTASKHWRQHATMTNSQFHIHYECYCQIFNTRRQTDRNLHITTILRRLLGPNQHPQLERGDFVRTKFSCHMPVITTTMHPD